RAFNSNDWPFDPSCLSYSRMRSCPITITRSPWLMCSANSSPFLSHTVTFLHVVPSSHQFPCWSFLRCDCASENPNTGVPCPVKRSSGLATFPITVISDILLLHKRNPNQDWLGLDNGVGLILGVSHEPGAHLSGHATGLLFVVV